MGFVTINPATDQGTLDLGGVQQVNEVAWYVVTVADLVSIDGFSPVRRLHHQAWWGLGITPTAGPTSGIVLIRRWGFVSLEGESFIFPTNGLVEADTLYFDVQPGAVMYCEVDW
jgi:hypothetical protein